jgi:hypothetical protein
MHIIKPKTTQCSEQISRESLDLRIVKVNKSKIINKEREGNK